MIVTNLEIKKIRGNEVIVIANREDNNFSFELTFDRGYLKKKGIPEKLGQRFVTLTPFAKGEGKFTKYIKV